MRKNLSLSALRAVLMVLLIVLGVGNAWGTKYYANLTISKSGQTGKGKVYYAKSNSKPSNETSGALKSDGTTSSGGTQTYYYWVDVDPGYNVTLSGGITAGPATSATLSGNVALKQSSSSGSGTSYSATANIVAVTVNSVSPASKDLAPTNPSTDYPFTVTFGTSNMKTIAIDMNKSPETTDGKFTITGWSLDGTNVVASGKFNGGGSYGGANRNNSTTVSLQSKAAGSVAKTCTVTANFPALELVNATATEVFTTQNDATRGGTAVFNFNYGAEDDFPTAPSFTHTSGAGAFTVVGDPVIEPDFSKGTCKVTVDYKFNPKGVADETTKEELKITSVGGTVYSVTVTGKAEAEATNDASVTPAGGKPTEYETFAKALEEANKLNGATLTLLRDVNLGTITATNNITKAMTIDLNGKELRAAVNASSVGILTITKAVAVTIKDSKTGGKIINEVDRNSEVRTIFVNAAGATLTLESGTLAVNNLRQYASAANASLGITAASASCSARVIHQVAGSTVNINGGRLEAYGTRSVYGIVQGSSAATNQAGTTVLNISGGEIYSEGPYNIFGVYAYGQVNFSGGTITSHVTTNMIDARYAADNANNLYNGYGYGIYLKESVSATATSCYAGILNMIGGIINVTNDRTYNVDRRNYGVFFNAASTVVAAGKTGADGSLTQKASATGSIDGGEINVTSGTQYSFGVYVLGNYNSYDNTYHTVQVKNCKITAKAYVYAYGVYANAGFNGTNNGCYAGDVELTNCDVYAESLNTSTAAAVWVNATGGTLYQDDTDATKSRCYGEYAVAGKATINSGKYEAKTKTTSAFAVGTASRYRTVYAPVGKAAVDRKPGGNAEAYPTLIIHGGTFKATSTTTTARGVSNGGYCTIDGGEFDAYATTTTAHGLYCLTGKLTASGVKVTASATGTAYGAYADVTIPGGNQAQTGFAAAGELELNNCDITATTRTSTEARGVVVNATNKLHSWAGFLADSTSYTSSWAANKSNYAAYYRRIFPCTVEGRDSVGIAIAGKATINGGTIKATAATTTAYGIYAVGSQDIMLDSIAIPELTVKNAKITVATNGTTSATGIYTQAETLVDGCDITVTPKTSSSYGIQAIAANDAKVTVKNTKITASGTATVYGLYATVDINAKNGQDRHGNFILEDGNDVSANATSGNTSYAVFLNATKRAITTPATLPTDWSAYRLGNYANAATAVINGGKYTATATGTTAYGIGMAARTQQGQALGIPECTVTNGKFWGAATGGTDGAVDANGQIGHVVLSGGVYNKNTNLSKFVDPAKNVNDLLSGSPEYNEGYRYKISSEITGAAVCRIYQNNTEKAAFATLKEGLQYVNNTSGTFTIVMVGNHVLPSGDYILPSTATLVVPSSLTQKAAQGNTPSREAVSTPVPVEFLKLTFDKGVNMTVKGTIETTAKQNAANGGSAIAGAPHGNYGRLHLVEGSKVTLESGSKFNCWGYCTGKGEIIAMSGSTVREGFQLGYWRGGTATSSMLSNKNTWHAFPVTDYFIQNVEAPILFRPGSDLYGYSAVNVSIVGVQSANDVHLLGSSGALFLMENADASADTWVRKEYEPATDRAVWVVNSGAKLGQFSFSLSGNTVNSADYYMPISNNMTIYVNEGEFTVTQDAMLIPGAQIIISKLGKLTVASGKRLFVMDNEDWPGFLKSGTTTVSRYYYNATYSPSWTSNPRTTLYPPTTTPLPDAEIFVQGTTEGQYYTTEHGANIHSTNEDAGVVRFITAAGGAQSIQHVVNTDNERVTISFTSAKLKNEDTSNPYTSTAGTVAGDAYTYMDQMWVNVRENGCLLDRTDGTGTHHLAHPSDVVAVVANSDDNAYHSETGSRNFVFAEKKVTTAGCVWWEAEKVTEGEYAGDYMANQDRYDNYGGYFYWDASSGYWKPRNVTVTWLNYDGTTAATYTNVQYNTAPKYSSAAPKTPANTTALTYSWVGWRDSEGNMYDKNAVLPRAKGNITYTAWIVETKVQSTITFKNQDNSVLWAGLVDHGTVPVCPVEPTQAPTATTEYTFTGWNTTPVAVTGPATYTAQYSSSPRKYTATFYNYDAVEVLYTAQVANGTAPVYEGVEPYRKNTSAYSYAWTGWKNGTNTYNTTAVLPAINQSNVSYIATFEQTELRYQVFFKRQDGSVISAPFYSYEETPAAFPANPTLASTESTEYTFREWSPAELVPVTEDGKVYTALFDESPRQYTAHFVNYDGKTLNADQTIDYNTAPAAYSGATPFKPNDTRNSYEFSGWAWEASNGLAAGSVGVGGALPAIKGDVTFTAQFTPVLLQFNVLFQREDGTQIQLVKKKWGENISTTFPTAANYEDETHSYTFTNWTPSTITTPVTADATYTAHYNQGPKTYSLTISVATASTGFGSVSPTSVTSIPSGTTVTENGNTFTVNGTTVTATPADETAQYTYAFKKWNNVPATVTGNVTNITAEFTRTLNTYTVTFNDYNGTELKKQTVDWNTAATAPANPSREGYNFTGWDKAFDAVTADLVVTAQYSAKSYEITLHTNEGTINTGNVTSYTYGVGATLPNDVTRANYLFEGWFDNSELTGSPVTTISTTATGDKDFWAKWKLNNFDVTFDVQGHGTAPEAQSIVANGKVTKPADPSETGWTFGGWYKEAGCTNAWNFSSDEVTANTILYAKWTRTKYTITWLVKLNGETEIEETEEVEHGEIPNYGPDPTKASDEQYDYSFTEWSPAPYAADKDQTYEGTFKATAHLYTITWVDEQVGVIETQQYRYGLTPDFTYNKPNSDGYTYTVTGWTPEIVAVTGDATYTAVYTARIAEKNVNTDETLSFDEDAEVTYVRASGSLNTNGHTLTTDNLILEADAMLNVSGEINGNVEATNVYFDLKLNTAARHWHAFGVPWDVNVTEHALMEVDADGNVIRTLVVGRDCEIVYYNGATRAAQGPGSHCWEYLKHYSEAGQPIEVMKPGKGYMIAFTSAVQTVRFTKADGADIFFAGTNSVVGGEGENGGWNALANPMAYYATLSAGPTVGYVHDGGEIGHDGYTPYNIDAKKYIVGKMVYVQAASDQTIVVNPAGDAGDMTTLAFASKRRAKATDKQYLSLNDYYAVSLSNGDKASKVYVLPEENKADEYVIGHDLSQFSMSTKKPQIWVNRYDTKLALNTTAPIANVAEFSVSLYAPATGEYTITTTFVPDEDYTVYLTQDGEAIWNLSDAPYAITLNKGTAKGYGIRLSRKAPQIATGIDEAVVDAKGDTRKVVINDKVFIIRGNHVYSAEGQLVK